ncbi:MAG: peptidoglycan glycosyltransferase FtsW [Paracoccaceae bacterium]
MTDIAVAGAGAGATTGPGTTAPKGEAILPRWWRSLDRWTLGCLAVLFALGLLLGLAASVPLAQRHGLSDFYFVTRQAQFGAVTAVVILALSMLSPEQVRRVGTLGFLASFAALAVLPVLGTDFGKGAVRWYSLGFVSVQPSEFLKPGFAVFGAWLIAAAHQVDGPPGRAWCFGLVVILAFMLALQPDFGQAALIVFVWGVMYFIGGARLWVLGLAGGLVAAAGSVAYGASEHFARRIDGFLTPTVDPRTQLGYAEAAIGQGGLFGVGVGEGRVKWTLPDAHTDFIIAVAAEEYGLIMVLTILALFATIVLRSLARLLHEPDPFTRIAGAGLACTLGIQAFINIGVAVRILPAKGMTLPFISYGGSSLIATGITAGLLLALTRTRPRHEMARLIGGGAH